jgi:hypothetical protein
MSATSVEAQAAQLICAVLETVSASENHFAEEAARRGIRIEQLVAAAIAGGLHEHRLLRPDASS